MSITLRGVRGSRTGSRTRLSRWRVRRCRCDECTPAASPRTNDGAWEEWDRSLLFRLRRAAASVPPFARVGLTVAFLVLVVRLVQPGVSVLPRASQYESLPISRFTPGATTNVSARDLCSGSLPIRRVVSSAVRQDVLQKYQMEHVASSGARAGLLDHAGIGWCGRRTESVAATVRLGCLERACQGRSRTTAATPRL